MGFVLSFGFFCSENVNIILRKVQRCLVTANISFSQEFSSEDTVQETCLCEFLCYIGLFCSLINIKLMMDLCSSGDYFYL